MAAVSVRFELFYPGDHIICSEALYGRVIQLLRVIGAKNGLEADYADISDLNMVRSLLRLSAKALYIQTPIALGADIVLHSGSKFISGHNDTIAGFLSSSPQTLADQIRLIAKTTGGTLASFGSWLILWAENPGRAHGTPADKRGHPGKLADHTFHDHPGVLRGAEVPPRLLHQSCPGPGSWEYDLLPHRYP